MDPGFAGSARRQVPGPGRPGVGACATEHSGVSVSWSSAEAEPCRTGKKRTVPLACYPYRDTIVVSASNSGQESHPAWYHNLKAHPEVMVQVGKERFRAFAEDVAADERDELWKKIVEMNKHQGEYLENVSREIPLVWFRRL